MSNYCSPSSKHGSGKLEVCGGELQGRRPCVPVHKKHIITQGMGLKASTQVFGTIPNSKDPKGQRDLPIRSKRQATGTRDKSPVSCVVAKTACP